VIKEMLLARLKEEEGFRAKPYYCPTGHLTIGYGRNLEANGISRDEAELMLQNDVDRTFDCCHLMIPFWDRLSDVRKLVLADMAFNMGIKGLLTFRRMLAYLEVDNFDCAAEQILHSTYALQVSKRAHKLANAMRSDIWSDSSTKIV
jgi:lysozyme